MTPLSGKLLPILAEKKSPTTLATSYVWCPIGSSAPTTASWGPSLNKLSFYLVALGNTRGSLASFFSLLQIRLGKRYHMLFRFTFLH